MVVLDKEPGKERETIELRASKVAQQAAAAPQQQQQQQAESLQDRLQAAAAGIPSLQAPQREAATGAALAAGVLTAVDEGEEGEEDAPVPNEFGYETDHMDQD